MDFQILGRSHQRQYKASRRTEGLDGGEGSDNNNDTESDTTKTNRSEIDLISSLRSPDLQSAENSPPDRSVKRKRVQTPEGERLTFDSDEDDNASAAYRKFKARNLSARSKTTAGRPRKNKSEPAGGRMNEPSAVKRKPGVPVSVKDVKPRKHEVYITDSDGDEPETALPSFLKDRKTKWDLHCRELGKAGLNLPPDYEDIDFPEASSSSEEKPVIHAAPLGPYQDVELRFSAGIVPAAIAQRLRPYQIQGAEFLHELFVYQRGGILGDDMGLGKTIQVIAFLTAAFGKTADERDAKRMRKMRRAGRKYPRVLIVCPGSLMQNWQNELETWGWWAVDVYHGSAKDRHAVLSSAKTGMLELMITTYSTYRLNKGAINLIEWDCVIADECHQIKERRSDITKAMNEVNALCRIGLTGTAIQNKYDELWTLLNWTNPGKFGGMAGWKQSISEPLKLGQSHDATVAQLAKARKTAKKLKENLLPRFFLRRLKSLIADQLPKKSDRVIFCPLSDEQADAYTNLVDSPMIDYIRTSSDPCDCESGKKRGWCCYTEVPGHGKWQHLVFPCLMLLQRLANHLAMLIPSSQDSKEKQEKDVEYLQIALPDKWRDLYRNRDKNFDNFSNQNFCGKWRVLKKLLSFWHSNGDKVLVFSHSVRLLKMLQILFSSTTRYDVSYLDGSMSYEERAKTVDEFNANAQRFVFLISTRAGGVGLNITSANKVVVFDPNWNPSWDLQAQDRAYRIGQTRDVEVFRLISVGTVEEIVYARQIYKQQQANIAYTASLERRYFRGVQDQKDMKGEIFGLVNLFSYMGEQVVLRDIVNKTNIAESKAGINVIGLDSTQGPGEEADLTEDAAISQLAAMITGEGGPTHQPNDTPASKPARRSDAVQAILAGAGVEYTHENSEVIGSSRIEARLSRRAEQAGNDMGAGARHVFGESSQAAGPTAAVTNNNNDAACTMAAKTSFTTARSDENDNIALDANTAAPGTEEPAPVRYKFRPPEQVRNRQFCSIARWYGYEDATEFGFLVEAWTQAKRRDVLEAFYRHRRKVLAEGAGPGE